jgi:hypothetical protein
MSHLAYKKQSKAQLRLLLLTLLFNFTLQVKSFSQSASEFIKPVNRFHLSPKAGEIFRQGNVPVNLSSGQLNYSVPIHTIQIGNFQWPISLNYAYNGLLLEGKPTEVGLGWSMAGGGAVIREVRGIPDEHQRGYWGPSNRRNLINAFLSPGNMALHFVKDFISNLYDAEPDKFTVSAGNLNFSFFIANGDADPSGCPFSAKVVTPNQENAKVCFSWDAIEVTDASGVKYVFKTKEMNEFTSPHFENMEYMQHYPSSWFLTEINLPIGRSIYFGYGSSTIQNISHNESMNRTASEAGIHINRSCAELGGLYNTGQAVNEYLRILDESQSSHESSMEALYLSGIAWDDGSLIFERNGGGSNISVPRVTGIVLKDGLNQPIHNFRLTYDFQARPLLANVVKNDIEKHTFEYNPVYTGFILQSSQNPYAQDFWGFANGKPNQSAIPEKGGNRNPDYENTKQGALTKITYPTGGTTEITYEPNEVKANIEEFIDQEPIEQPNRHFSVSVSNPPINQPFSDIQEITFMRPTFAKISHGAFIKGTSSWLNMTFGPNVLCININCQQYDQYATFKRLSKPGETPRFFPFIGVALTGDVDNTYTGKNCGSYFSECNTGGINDWILIEPGTYGFSANGVNTEGLSYYFYIDYYDPDPSGDSPSGNSPFIINKKTAGIRVKSTIDCPGSPTNGSCITKIFDYAAEDGYSSGVHLNKIDYSYSYHVYDAINCRDNTQAEQGGSLMFPLYLQYDYDAIAYSFRTLNPLEFHAGSPVYYNRVSVSTTGSGKEITYFENSTYGLTGFYPYAPLPPNPLNGVPYKIETYKETTQGFEMIKSTEIQNSVRSPTLNMNPDPFPDGMVFGIRNEYRYVPLWDVNVYLNYILTEGYGYNKYEVEKPTKLVKLSQTETFYPGGYSQTTSNTYNDKLLPISTATTDSKGKTLISTFAYPGDLNGSGYNELVAQNNISSPVRITESVNGSQLKSTQTFYQNWASSPNLVLPQRIEVTQGGTTYIEMVVLSYDDKGNPLEVKGKDDVRKSFLWGYNQMLPIASTVNASVNEIYFNSFETDSDIGNSVDNDSHTGTKSKLNGFSKDLTPLSPNKNYWLTFWRKKTDGTWEYNSQLINVVSESYPIRLSGQLDDIRFYPENSQMTTYTYKPLVGITSSSDSNSLPTYYEYDNGRLKLVRDADRKVVSHNQYNYIKKN